MENSKSATLIKWIFLFDCQQFCICITPTVLSTGFTDNFLRYMLAGVGAGGEEQAAESISILHLPWMAFAVSILFVGILL